METKRYIIFFVILAVFWPVAVSAQFDNTIALIVRGNSDCQAVVQQTLFNALQNKGFKVVLTSYYSKSSPYRGLETEIDRKNGPTQDSRSSGAFYEKHTIVHYDTIVVTVTLWQGDYAVMSGSATAIAEWQWQEIIKEGLLGGKKSTITDNEAAVIRQTTMNVALTAFNQIDLQNQSVSITPISPPIGDDTFISFLEREKYGNFDIGVFIRSGMYYVVINDKNTGQSYKGKGESINQAFLEAIGNK